MKGSTNVELEEKARGLKFTNFRGVLMRVELGGRVVRVLDSGQLHQSERSWVRFCLLYTSPSPRDRTRSRMPSSA